MSAPAKIILVLTAPRSGTHLFMSLLDQHPDIECKHGETESVYEPLGGTNGGDALATVRGTRGGGEYEAVAERLCRLAGETTAEWSAFAVHDAHLQALGLDLTPFVEAVRDYADDLRVVVLERLHRWDAYRSLRLALAANYWREPDGQTDPRLMEQREAAKADHATATIRFDPDDWRRWLQASDDWFEEARRSAPDHVSTTYEAVVRDPDAAIRETTAEMGLARLFELEAPGWKKHPSRTDAELFANYDEHATEIDAIRARYDEGEPAFEDLATIIVKTGGRPDCLDRLLMSIARFAPRVRVIVTDDSGTTKRSTIDRTAAALNIDLDWRCLPDDAGKPYGVNYAATLVETPFLILMDDDMILTDESAQWLVAFLSRNPEFGVCCGWVIDVNPHTGAKGVREPGGSLMVDRNDGEDFDHLFIDNAAHAVESGRWDLVNREYDGTGAMFARIDYGLHFLAARTEDFRRVRLDTAIKIGGEHLDHMLALKAADVKLALLVGASCEHMQSPLKGAAYATRRNRGPDGVRYVLHKWGLGGFRDLHGNVIEAGPQPPVMIPEPRERMDARALLLRCPL